MVVYINDITDRVLTVELYGKTIDDYKEIKNITKFSCDAIYYGDNKDFFKEGQDTYYYTIDNIDLGTIATTPSLGRPKVDLTGYHKLKVMGLLTHNNCDEVKIGVVLDYLEMANNNLPKIALGEIQVSDTNFIDAFIRGLNI